MSKHRGSHTFVESLEDRLLFAIVQPPPGSDTPVGLLPKQIDKTYGFDALYQQLKTGKYKQVFQTLGEGMTIAIVAVGHDPTLQDDLNTFDSTKGVLDPQSLPTVQAQAPMLTINTTVDQNDNFPQAAIYSTEEAMMVEWVHALVPLASIAVFETPPEIFSGDEINAYFQGISSASAYINSLPAKSGVVLMAQGFPEDIGLNNGGFGNGGFGNGNNDDVKQLEGVFTDPKNAGISYIAPAGITDNGDSDFNGFFNSGLSYAGTSPNVLAVGGTALGAGLVAGAGETATTPDPLISHYSDIFAQPPYQDMIKVGNSTLNKLDPDFGVHGHRAVPDVTFDSDTGVAVYDSTGAGGWVSFASQGLGVAAWGAITTIANQLRSSQGAIAIGENLDQTIYSLGQIEYKKMFNDVGPTKGFDLLSGWGSPKAGGTAFTLAGIISGNTKFSANFTEAFYPTGPAISDLAIKNFTGTGNVNIAATQVTLALVVTNLRPGSYYSGTGAVLLGTLTRVGKRGFKGIGTAAITPTNGGAVNFTLRISGLIYTNKKTKKQFIRANFVAVDAHNQILKHFQSPLFEGHVTSGSKG